MASTVHFSGPANTPDTPVSIKVTIDGSTRKFKLPLRELSAAIFVPKLREILKVTSDQKLVLERFSDSSGCFVLLDSNNPSSYKQLYRAAKAKFKLRLRAQVTQTSHQNQGKDASKAEEIEMPNCQPAKPQSPTSGRALPSDSSKPPTNRVPTSHTLFPEKMNAAPLPGDNAAREKFVDKLAGISGERSVGLRMKEAPAPQSTTTCWQVCCNRCDNPVADTHYHCSTCDGGDYDLCEPCVNAGFVCRDEGHWLIKRFIKNGNVISSTTERVIPKRRTQELGGKEMPGSFQSEVKAESTPPEPRRTCNGCVRVLPEKFLLTCENCRDFDLCISCHHGNEHGHHPGHIFKPVSQDLVMTSEAASLCAAGRGQRHHAICDGCEKAVVGVRHKCLDCPDFDFCGKCIDNGRRSHGHRFVPVYEPLAAPAPAKSRHYGIYCDGPLCKGNRGKGYITGVRYKCAVCYDTDFCDSCEAHPDNHHNQTHPLIKFKTMVKDVSVSTITEPADGERPQQLGDDVPPHNASNDAPSGEPTATLPPHIADCRGTISTDFSALQKTLHCGHLRESTPTAQAPGLNALFLRDSIADGTQLPPDKLFVQTWTLNNPGPQTWPAGCSVRYVGGDNMLILDSNRPTSFTELSKAQESNRTLREVAPGESANFCVAMKAPSRPGKYISYWRLKAPDGTPFGHKLWCDIEITAKCEQSSPVGLPTVKSRDSLRARLRELASRPPPPMIPASTNEKKGQQAESKEYASREMRNVSAPRINPEKPLQYDIQNLNSLRQKMLGVVPKPGQERPMVPPVAPTPPKPGVSTALADYEKQLMLLEQQNKKRLLLARQEHMQAIEKDSNAESSIVPTKPAKPVEIPPPPKPEIPGPEPISSDPVPVAPQTQKGGNDVMRESAMVFPTLEKESPASSTHEDAPVKNQAPTTQTATANSEVSGNVQSPEQPASSSTATEATAETEIDGLEDVKDVESIDFSDSDDDGFLTDEEYDILDASDEEIITGGAASKG